MTETAQLGLVSLEDSDLTLADPADDLRGRTVVDLCHHRVGEVCGLIIDVEQRRPRLLVVVSGGIMGLARTKSLVPVDAVTRADDVVHIEAAHQQVQSATYDPDRAPSPAYQEVCRHYGYLPFWTPGYVDPPLLRRWGA